MMTDAWPPPQPGTDQLAPGCTGRIHFRDRESGKAIIVHPRYTEGRDLCPACSTTTGHGLL